MSVLITDSCISCDACIDECPATAIVSSDGSPLNDDRVYVKPEKCIECVDAAVPKCADVCPSKGSIVWDMPYTAEYNGYFVNSDNYVIRIHKRRGLLSPANQERPFREDIDMRARIDHASIGETLRLYVAK